MRWLISIMLLMMVVQIVDAITIDRGMPVWNVTKTDAEVNVDVSISNINETFAVAVFRPNEKYIQDISLTGKSITNVPVTKISGDFRVQDSVKETSTLDFSKDSVLYIYHDGDVNLKVGYGSIIIYSGSGLSLNLFSNTIAFDSNNNIHAVLEDDFRIKYFNSTDNNTFITSTKMNIGSILGTILINSSDGYHIIYMNGSSDKLNILYSEDDINYGHIEGTPSYNAKSLSCDINESDVIHCCLATGSYLYYITSINWSNYTYINEDSIDNTDICSLRVAQNNCVYIAGIGSVQDDVDIWSECLNGFGSANRILVNSSTTFGNSFISMYIDREYINIATIDTANDIWYFNSTVDNGLIWNAKEFVGSYYTSLRIFSTDGSVIQRYICYKIGTTQRCINSSNSINWGSEYVVVDLGLETNSELSLQGNNFPSFSRLTNRLHFIAVSENAYYSNMTVDGYLPYLEGNYTTFSVQVADSQDSIVFNSSLKTAVHLNPQGQTDGQPIFNVTNNGNVNINVTLQLNMSLEAGFEAYWDTDNDPSGSKRLNETRQLITLSLAPSAKQSVWMWTNFTNQLPNYFERNMTIGVNQTDE